MCPTIYALSSSSGRILTEKENVCVGISFPRVNKNGAEKIFNAIESLASSGVFYVSPISFPASP
jgi:hypothetical protein